MSMTMFPHGGITPKTFLRLAPALPGRLTLTGLAVPPRQPFRVARDGGVLANNAGFLPAVRGAYREYTVTTPGRRDRGVRTLVAIERAEF